MIYTFQKFLTLEVYIFMAKKEFSLACKVKKPRLIALDKFTYTGKQTCAFYQA